MPGQDFSDSDLIAGLEARGVRYLRPATISPAHQAIPTPELVARLASHPAPRFRETLIPLFLAHPEYAELLPACTAALPPDTAVVLKHFYTAAVYLQRMWRGNLESLLGAFPDLPDHYGQSEFKLPAPDDYFGEKGLRQLARCFEALTGANWWQTYQDVIELFMKQLGLRMAQVEPGS